ncbi:MAG: sulfatase [Deltaproteobacteria bacterium]|nr:sulfatase [Deltaproteobacteria bacterium]
MSDKRQNTRVESSIIIALLFTLALFAVLSCSKRSTSGKQASAPEATSANKSAVAAAGDQPNLILISIDTLRRDRLGVYGYEKATSPVIDRLAAESVVFDTAISAQTNTAPSHATIFTGLFPGSHGILRNGMRLKEKVPTMASILKEEGYATGGFISGWTLTPHTDLQRGFDEYNAAFSGSRREGEITWALAKRWLRDKGEGEKPFFLFLHLFEPHFPYVPPAQYALRFLPEQSRLEAPDERDNLPGLKIKLKLEPKEEREYEARYNGEVLFSDIIVERLLNELKRTRIQENTLMILLSDHGETLFEREWVADHGGRVYDEQLRVPLIVHFPDKKWAARRIEQQVTLVDVLPTVLDFLRCRKPERLEGRSLLALIKGSERDKAPHPAFSHARPEPVRVPEISARLSKKGLISSIRLPNVKLVEYPLESGGWYQQLFDLQADPDERVNLAQSKPDLVKKLHQQLAQWRIRTGVETQSLIPRLSKEIEKGLRSLGYVE